MIEQVWTGFVVVSGPPASGKTTLARVLAPELSLPCELPAPVVEVFCRCDPATVADRFASRAASQGPGHFAADRTQEELWNDEVGEPVAGGWPVIEVDTNRPVDIDVLVAELHEVRAH